MGVGVEQRSGGSRHWCRSPLRGQASGAPSPRLGGLDLRSVEKCRRRRRRAPRPPGLGLRRGVRKRGVGRLRKRGSGEGTFQTMTETSACLPLMERSGRHQTLAETVRGRR